MSLDNTAVVDAVGIDKETGAAVLTIADSWDWSDQRRHLLALQDKINCYLGFIESGEILQCCPDSFGRRKRIDVIVRFPVPESVAKFISHSAEVCAEYEVELRFRHSP